MEQFDGPLLELETMIGFGGAVINGLKVHPDRQHLIYPVGCTVVIENINTNKQHFLSGHSNSVSCIAMTNSGRFIASGQITHMGYKADIILWDYTTRQAVSKFTLHKAKVEALAFSPNDKYLVSLGGEDDGSVVVWCMQRREAVCGSPAQHQSAGITHCITFANTRDDCFITAGNGTVRIWELDRPNRKIRPTDVSMGQIKRIIKSVVVAEDDSYFFCGTTTGDVLAMNMKTQMFIVNGPEKGLLSGGVTALVALKGGEIVVGTGDGTVCQLQSHDARFKRTKKTKTVKGAITSIALRGQGNELYVGTDQSNIYSFKLAEFTAELVKTCHNAPIKDVAFAHGCSELLATCSQQEIRIWSMSKNQELLRIVVPNMTCNCVEIMKDGKSIVSGWDDGRIRAFYPETGKPMYTIENAHLQPVTALALAANCRQIISGGKDGSVRIWMVERKSVPKGFTYTTTLKCTLKEHKASVTCIKLQKNNAEAVTSSDDGSCIIWDLVNEHRRQMIRVNTLFRYVLYHPQEHQLLTCGTDRKVGYWETYDGSMIRELDGSKSGSLNALGISEDGLFFVSCGDDKLVKVWTYEEGVPHYIGVGHSAPITRVAISPDQKFIISVSVDGAILRWKFPFMDRNTYANVPSVPTIDYANLYTNYDSSNYGGGGGGGSYSYPGLDTNYDGGANYPSLGTLDNTYPPLGGGGTANNEYSYHSSYETGPDTKREIHEYYSNQEKNGGGGGGEGGLGGAPPMNGGKQTAGSRNGRLSGSSKGSGNGQKKKKSPSVAAL